MSLAEEARKRETRLVAAMIRVSHTDRTGTVTTGGSQMDRLADAIDPDGTSPVKTKGEKI